MSRAKRHEKWRTILSELESSISAASQFLSDYDRKKPADIERHSSWHWARKSLASDVSSLREAIEIAEMEIKFSQPVSKKVEAGSESTEQFKISDLMQCAPDELTDAERSIRACLIRSQEKLKESGHRNDPSDRPNQSGGYQIDKNL